jgi:ComEC/Rec2-related protein
VAAFFFGATRLILKRFPPLLLRLNLNKTSALVAIVPVIFYTFIAGLGVAAVRSTIMTLSFLLALLLDREKDLYDALFVAAFLILVVTPAALFDISFQFSFISVLAILYLIPRLTEYFLALKIWPEKAPEAGPPRWKQKALTYLTFQPIVPQLLLMGNLDIIGMRNDPEGNGRVMKWTLKFSPFATLPKTWPESLSSWVCLIRFSRPSFPRFMPRWRLDAASGFSRARPGRTLFA